MVTSVRASASVVCAPPPPGSPRPCRAAPSLRPPGDADRRGGTSAAVARRGRQHRGDHENSKSTGSEPAETSRNPAGGRKASLCQLRPRTGLGRHSTRQTILLTCPTLQPPRAAPGRRSRTMIPQECSMTSRSAWLALGLSLRCSPRAWRRRLTRPAARSSPTPATAAMASRTTRTPTPSTACRSWAASTRPTSSRRSRSTSQDRAHRPCTHTRRR